MTIENMEGAIAMLEAYLSGGDELGIVPTDDACEALNFIRGAVEWMHVERKDFPPEYLLDRVEELAVRVYGLESERDDLEKKLEVVTGERDTSRQMLIAERETLQAHRNASAETITHLVGLKNALESRLDTVTAERDALKAQLDAVPVKAIDFYFFHVDEEVAMIDADIPGNPEAMVNAAVQIGDWLNSTRR